MSTNPLSFLLNRLLPLLPLPLLPLLALLSLLAHSAGPLKIQSHIHVVIPCYTITCTWSFVYMHIHLDVVICCHTITYTWSYVVGRKTKKETCFFAPCRLFLAFCSVLLAPSHFSVQKQYIFQCLKKTLIIPKLPLPARLPSACCAPAPPAPEVPHLGF